MTLILHFPSRLIVLHPLLLLLLLLFLSLLALPSSHSNKLPLSSFRYFSFFFFHTPYVHILLLLYSLFSSLVHPSTFSHSSTPHSTAAHPSCTLSDTPTPSCIHHIPPSPCSIHLLLYFHYFTILILFHPLPSLPRSSLQSAPLYISFIPLSSFPFPVPYL